MRDAAMVGGWVGIVGIEVKDEIYCSARRSMHHA